ncbi:1133_t:CDS:1, partial [Gigaspora margarita]
KRRLLEEKKILRKLLKEEKIVKKVVKGREDCQKRWLLKELYLSEIIVIRAVELLKK